MADVYAVFGTLLALGIAFPGMLLAYRLLFPGFVGRAQARLRQGGLGSLVVGGMGALLLALPIAVLLALPFGPARFVGGVLLLLSLAFASLGAAGLTGVMGEVYRQAGGEGMTEISAYLRGAVALALAAAFPLLGWFLVIPLVTVASFGAALGATLGRGATDPSARRERAAAGAVAHEPQSA